MTTTMELRNNANTGKAGEDSDIGELPYRYPGAGPFQDDDISRKMFFGRDKEIQELTSRVEVCQLTIVYGRSGLGKSSLLQAGLTTPLRENGYFPVFVRVNHTVGSLITSIANYVEAEASRRGVEHVRGLAESPWEYFKTLELWADDRLLVPVIIFDQFEEIFSIDNYDLQDMIIEDLGSLVRGTPSSKDEESLVLLEEKYGSAEPALRIVVSIREDYLGFLEEVADEIPGIFDSRFRLTPLNISAAGEALSQPAAVANYDFNSPVFKIDPDLLSRTLDFLSSKRRITDQRRKKPGIEPFQLQLVGRRFEDIASRAFKKKSDPVVLTFNDVGGNVGLTKALGDFYASALATVDGWRTKRKVKSLCIDHLISPDGKRQSLDAESIETATGLKEEVLLKLAKSRLLRIDTRADTRYYELSHDTLVAPILASQGVSAKFFQFVKTYLLTFYSFSVIAGTIGVVVSTVSVFAQGKYDEAISLGFASLLSVYFTFKLLKWAANSRRRHSRLQRVSQQSDESVNERPGFFKKCIAGVKIIYGPGILVFGVMATIVFPTEILKTEKLYLDSIITSIGLLITSTAWGVRLVRNGFGVLSGGVIPNSKPENITTSQPGIIKQSIRMVSSVIFLIVTLFQIAVLILPITDCQGKVFDALNTVMLQTRLSNLKNWCENIPVESVGVFLVLLVFSVYVWFGWFLLYKILCRKLLI